MAAYLLRLFGATLASMVLALLLTLAALRAAAAGAASPEQVASLALAQAFADRAPLLIPGLVGVGGILAGGGLLFLGAVCTAAVRTRWRSRTPRPGPTPATTTGGEEKMTTGSGGDTPITAGSMPQGANRSGPGAIAPGRAPAAGPSIGTCRRHATLRLVFGTIAAGVIAFAAAFWAMASPPLAVVFVTQAAASAGIEFLTRALPVLADILLPFPLAGALAVAVLCAVATWPADSPCRTASENRHGNHSD